MLVTKDNTYKIMEIDKKDLSKFQEMGFFECDKHGKAISVKSKAKKGK